MIEGESGAGGGSDELQRRGKSLGGSRNVLYFVYGSIPFVQIHRNAYKSDYILFSGNYEVIKRNTIRTHRILPSMKMV